MLRQLGGALATFICTLLGAVTVQHQGTGYSSNQLEHCRTPCEEPHATRCCDFAAGAGAGALIGGPVGAGVGGAIGAGTGAVIGSGQDKQDRREGTEYQNPLD